MSKALGLVENLIKLIDSQNESKCAAPPPVLPPPTTPPSFRITYFAIMGGRCGPIRAAAAIGGIAFEDRFVSFAEHKQEKSQGKRRWSGLPEIEILNQNGDVVTKFAQSGAILRYVGAMSGLYPEKNVLKCALIDEITDAVEDVMAIWVPAYFASSKGDNEQKTAQEAILKEDKMPYWMDKFNNRLVENEKRGNKNGFVVGDSLSIADLKLYYGLVVFLKGGPFKYIDPQIIHSHAALSAFVQKIAEVEALKRFEKVIFANSQKENKENNKNNFRYDGKGVYQ